MVELQSRNMTQLDSMESMSGFTDGHQNYEVKCKCKDRKVIST